MKNENYGCNLNPKGLSRLFHWNIDSTPNWSHSCLKDRSKGKYNIHWSHVTHWSRVVCCTNLLLALYFWLQLGTFTKFLGIYSSGEWFEIVYVVLYEFISTCWGARGEGGFKRMSSKPILTMLTAYSSMGIDENFSNSSIGKNKVEIYFSVPHSIPPRRLTWAMPKFILTLFLLVKTLKEHIKTQTIVTLHHYNIGSLWKCYIITMKYYHCYISKKGNIALCNIAH